MITLKAEKRDTFGKKLAEERKLGRLPIAAYGPGEKTIHLFTNLVDFVKVWKKAGESTVVKIETESGAKDTLIQEVVKDPVSGIPIHADFYIVKEGMKVKVNVPITFIGVAPAIKLGGVLVKVMHDLEVEASPADLPHELTADISLLETFESRVTVKDIKLPAKVTATADADDVVALVSEAKEEVIEEPVAVDLTQIEVEKKGKKEEEGAEGATPASEAKKPEAKKEEKK